MAPMLARMGASVFVDPHRSNGRRLIVVSDIAPIYESGGI